ncbi:unnamed protein product [Prorocentrum cordatum]|uniref:Uncharacterized protein n=1 Tax=Prorocentrum cordatum TaxID=2364126 RepID=A0ABN9UPK6_9DINO|nr:unnamed protein product [Polarella glacialis]
MITRPSLSVSAAIAWLVAWATRAGVDRARRAQVAASPRCADLRCSEPPACPSLACCPAAAAAHCPSLSCPEPARGPRAAGAEACPPGGAAEAPAPAPAEEVPEAPSAARGGSWPVLGWVQNLCLELLGGAVGVIVRALLLAVLFSVCACWRTLLAVARPAALALSDYETCVGTDADVAAVHWSESRRPPPPGRPSGLAQVQEGAGARRAAGVPEAREDRGAG